MSKAAASSAQIDPTVIALRLAEAVRDGFDLDAELIDGLIELQRGRASQEAALESMREVALAFAMPETFRGRRVVLTLMDGKLVSNPASLRKLLEILLGETMASESEEEEKVAIVVTSLLLRLAGYEKGPSLTRELEAIQDHIHSSSLYPALSAQLRQQTEHGPSGYLLGLARTVLFITSQRYPELFHLRPLNDICLAIAMRCQGAILPQAVPAPFGAARADEEPFLRGEARTEEAAGSEEDAEEEEGKHGEAASRKAASEAASEEAAADDERASSREQDPSRRSTSMLSHTGSRGSSSASSANWTAWEEDVLKKMLQAPANPFPDASSHMDWAVRATAEGQPLHGKSPSALAQRIRRRVKSTTCQAWPDWMELFTPRKATRLPTTSDKTND